MEYFSGLLQPWRRVNRAEFVAALTILSLPGLLMMLNGMVSGGAGLLGPLLDLPSNFQAAQAGQAEALQALTNQLTATPTTPANDAVPLDMAGLINGLCLLLLTPYLRGRLLDMGYSARTSMVGSWALQLSVLNTTLQALLEISLLPYAWAFGLLTAVGYTWLTVRGSQAKSHLINGVRAQPSHAKFTDNDDYPKL